MSRPIPGRPVLRALAAAVAGGFGLAVLFYACALGFRPALLVPARSPSPEAAAQAERAREPTLDLRNPPRITREVNYAEGRRGAWWPKGEAPVLAQLVREAKLPPVEERVGPEPIVMEGVDGIGRYGGTWQRLAASDFDVATIASLLSYCNLVRWSPEGYPIVPHLAKSWEISDGYRTFTFHLRRGMRWSDGAPVTSDDFVYWYKMEVQALNVAAPDILHYPGTGEIAVVAKVDDYTVRFSFSRPYVLFLERLASLRTLPGDLYAEYCVPAHYLRHYHPLYGDQALIARTMREKNIPTPRALYTYLKGWRNPDQPRLWPWIMRSRADAPPYVFVRNPYYPAVDTRGNQLPYLDRLVMEVRPQTLFDLSASAGQVSMQDRYIRYEDHVLLASAARRNGYQVYYWYPGNRSAFTIFPVINRRVYPARPDTAWKHRLLNDRRFRQALSLAIKRREIIDALFNGQGEPAQIDPGPQSEFFDAKLFGSFTAYDPAGAGARLDALGLTHRDRDGFRTFPDGTRMTWYLSMTEATNNDPARFVIDDWAAVGVRCIPQTRGRELWYMQKGTLDQDFAVHHGESEFMPLIDPHNFVPTYGEAFYAPAYGYWYLFGGMDHSPGADVPRAIAPPPHHPLRRNMELLDRIYRTPDPAARIALFRQIQDSDAEEVWTISIATPPPELVIVKDGFRNVPRTAVSEGSFETPGNAGLETYFWDHPHDPPAVIAALREALIPPDAASAPAGRVVTAVLRWSLAAAAAALLVLAAARHPYIGRRLLLMVPTLFVLSIVIFLVVQLPPGDFATLREMEYASEGTLNSAEAIHELRVTFHLDESLTSRYLRWTGLRWFATFKAADTGLLQGDLGRSMEYNRSVNAVIGNRILLTVLVTFAALFFTWLVALPAGIYCAARQYSAGDHLLTFLGFLGLSVPGFVLALVLMFWAHRYFGLAVSGLFSTEFATVPGWSWAKGIDLLKHIWIPVLVLGLGGAAGLMRVMRANLLDEIRKPYVTTARAKGLSETRLLLKYPVRLALNPLVSSVGGQFPELVSGGAIVAIVLSLPLVGPVLLDALLSQDAYLAGSLLMVLSVLAVAGTLISDLLLLWVDPRIRFERGGG